MKKVYLMTVLILFTLVFVITGCAEPAPDPTAVPTEVEEPADAEAPEPEAPAVGAEGAELLEARCTKCHSLVRVHSAAKSADAWRSTVQRMVGKGAELADTEQEMLIEYLAITYPK